MVICVGDDDGDGGYSFTTCSYGSYWEEICELR